MKITIFFIALLSLSCVNHSGTISSFRNDFSPDESKILAVARTTINDAYFGSLISVDKTGQPRARIMEPFAPEKDFTIWLATNPKSRKVRQIEDNPKVTLHFFDKQKLAYVSLMGKAYLVNDSKIKATKWKKGWEKFYKNKEDAYLLIHFVPEYLELINIAESYTGDSLTWKPHRVVLRQHKKVAKP